MRLRSSFLIAATALTVAAPSAAAAKVLGPDDGVTATRAPTQVNVAFTPAALAAAKLKPGAQVEASCQTAPRMEGLLLDERDEDVDGVTTSGDVGADGAVALPLAVQDLEHLKGALDFCDIARVDPIGATSDRAVPVARAGLTPAGLTWVDESLKSGALADLLQAARAANAQYRPLAQLGRPDVEPLPSADAAPPADGHLGYWTDGRRATVAVLSAAGEPLIMQDLGGAMLRSNALQEYDTTTDESESSGDGSGAFSSTSTGFGSASTTPSPLRDRLPLRPADGVHAALDGRHLSVRFDGHAAASYRKLAGRRLRVVCEARPWPEPVLPIYGSGGIGHADGAARVPRHGGGGRVRFALGGHAAVDACVLTDDGTLVALAAPTDRGRRWVEDIDATVSLFSGDFDKLIAPGAQAYRSAADAVRRLGRGFVALKRATSAAPAGSVGVWTDGADRAVLSTRSASGRTLVIADDGGGFVRANVYGDVSQDLFLAVLFAQLGAGTTSGNGR